MQDNSQLYVKIGIGGIALSIILAIIFTAWHFISIAGKEKVAIYAAPIDSIVTIDGKKIKEDQVYLKKGEYTYTVTREHFTPISGKLLVKDDGTSSIIAPLMPLDNEGQTIYEQRRTDFLRLEDFANTNATIKGEDFQEKNPIVSMLPYSNMIFTIGYKNDTADKTGDGIIVTIHAIPTYYDAAVTQLNNWGYDPVDYKIEIKNEENPFK